MPSDDWMRELGFTDHLGTHWYQSIAIDRHMSFEVRVSKGTGGAAGMLMSRDFGQPEPYQMMTREWYQDTAEAIDSVLRTLADSGIKVPYTHPEWVGPQ